MIDRRLIGTIRKSLARYPVVGLIGCRQVGKMTLSKIKTEESKDVLYLDLELPSTLVQNRFFTTESQRAQRDNFYLAGRYHQIKSLLSLQNRDPIL